MCRNRVPASFVCAAQIALFRKLDSGEDVHGGLGAKQQGHFYRHSEECTERVQKTRYYNKSRTRANTDAVTKTESVDSQKTLDIAAPGGGSTHT